MLKRLIYVMTFVLALGGTAHAALYVWNGSAGDGLWDTPANWTVTDSAWTWPNEERGDNHINSDTLAIDIVNGGVVTRDGGLGIEGAADGSTTAVLTISNASTLITTGHLATGTDSNEKGQIDILGGSSVDVGNGMDILIADAPGSWGVLNIVDSTVNIADDLRTDNGEGYINISGNTTVNCDDLVIADPGDGVGYLDISGTTTVNIVDDFKIDQGIGIVTIGGDAVINFGDDCYLPDQADGQGTMTLTGNSVFNVGDDMTIADDAGTVGHVIVTGNATLTTPDELYLADDPTAFATLDVNGTATVNIGDDLNIGEDGPGICNIGENATVNIADDIYVAHNVAKGAFESHMTISGNATVNADDFIVANNAGLTGYLEISGNPTISTKDDFIMNDDSGASPSYSQVIMNGGTVDIGDQTTINDDINGTAEFIMNGGSFYSDDDIYVSDNLDGTAHLTINGGTMITGDNLKLGDGGGEDTGQVRVFINGGLLQAEGLSSIKITDTKIIYSGGLFRIGSGSLDVAGMEQMIADGTIVADGVHSVITNGAYTELNSVSPALPQGPVPADGAEDVLLGTTLSWAAGNTTATHDVHFGTSSPPPLIRNQEATTYYPGPIEVGTTYYWQIVEIEADGTTKHAGDVWSFTTTADLSTVSEIATQPDPADGAVGVAEAILSWWPGASAVSHDVYFGTTSPPALLGSTVELSIDAGPTAVDTTYYWQVNAVAADGTIHAGDTWSFKGPRTGTGSIARQVWLNIGGGNEVAILRNHPDFPANPSFSDELTSFATPSGIADEYGSRLQGYLHPETSGDYTFWIASDDNGELWLSTDENPANAVVISSVSASTGYLNFDDSDVTPSGPISLEAGKKYYIEAIYKEGIGGDHCAVAWQGPDSPERAVIHGYYLSPYAELRATGPDPADGAVEVSKTPTLTWVPGGTAASHDVYFGDSDPPPFVDNQTAASYNPAGLEKSKTYYWRIDEVEADGTTKHTGDVWSFTVTAFGR